MRVLNPPHIVLIVFTYGSSVLPARFARLVWRLQIRSEILYRNRETCNKTRLVTTQTSDDFSTEIARSATERDRFQTCKYKACIFTHLPRWRVAQSHVEKAPLHPGKMVQGSFSWLEGAWCVETRDYSKLLLRLFRLSTIAVVDHLNMLSVAVKTNAPKYKSMQSMPNARRMVSQLCLNVFETPNNRHQCNKRFVLSAEHMPSFA